MKNKNKLFTVLLIVIIFCIAAFQLYRLTEPKVIGQITATPDPFVLLLKESISPNLTNRAQKIVMSDITPFKWEKMYIVEPYTLYSEIEQRVGDNVDKQCYDQILVSDSYTLLLFVNGSEVVYCSYFPRLEGIFIIPSSKYLTGISKQEAIFFIDDNKRLTLISN